MKNRGLLLLTWMLTKKGLGWEEESAPWGVGGPAVLTPPPGPPACSIDTELLLVSAPRGLHYHVVKVHQLHVVYFYFFQPSLGP